MKKTEIIVTLKDIKTGVGLCMLKVQVPKEVFDAATLEDRNELVEEAFLERIEWTGEIVADQP